MNVCTQTCKTSLFFLLIGICLAFFSLSPKGIYFEEEYGLPLLFKLRGATPAPKNVIIVSIDELSAQILHLPDDPEKWPRSYYAQLINKINIHNPAVIAFNMTFDEKREPKNDHLLAKAMAKNNNIILSTYLKRQAVQSSGSLSEFKIERIISPIAALEEAALDIAPFPLPKTSTTVKQFWAYKNSAGDIATFPATVFQCYVFKQAYTEIIQLLKQIKPDHNLQLSKKFKPTLDGSKQIKTIQRIQSLISSDQRTLEQASQYVQTSNFSMQKKQLLSAWIALLNKPSHLYFNYYGEAESIPTIPFYQALLSDIFNPELFQNKIVLVGYSKTIEPEKATGLYTVFSNSDEDITSPIEIAATAVANLSENTWLKPLETSTQLFILFGWSVILCLLPRLFSYQHVIGLMAVLTLAYLYIAYSVFINHSIWMPILFPVIIQLPIIVTIISILHFLKGSKDRNKMQQAFSLYIPDTVVNSITQDHEINALNHFGELMQGVCMATDAGEYTTLAETMDPQQLHRLINNYYGVLFPLVEKNKGIISDVIGDAMFAIWNNTESEEKARSNACLTALNIKLAVDQFNASQPHKIPTRIGIHFGNIRLGNVGAANHFEYRAVGDTVNTAARIEGLNKLLGTQILVTAEVIKGLDSFLTREIGFFILKGKSQAVHVYELMADIKKNNPHTILITSHFSKALNLFQNHQWLNALAIWQALAETHPEDGPTLFYINYVKQLIKQNNKNLSTIIKVANNTSVLQLDE